MSAWPKGAKGSLVGNGWTLAGARAEMTVMVRRPARATVWNDGRWQVEVLRQGVVASGMESHPCGAASDALEILWAWRDRQEPPTHVQRYLTPAGRAAFGLSAEAPTDAG